MNSNRKGKVYEREIAKYLREHGYTDAHRGQQYHGGADSPDVVGLDGFHIEAKRTERFDLYGALEQSRRDAGDGEIPIVIHRKNGKESVVVIALDDFMEVLHGRDRGDPASDRRGNATEQGAATVRNLRSELLLGRFPPERL